VRKTAQSRDVVFSSVHLHMFLFGPAYRVVFQIDGNPGQAKHDKVRAATTLSGRSKRNLRYN
jgi:hypothetical protein